VEAAARFTDLLIGFVGCDPRVLGVLATSRDSLLDQSNVTEALPHIHIRAFTMS
jgi:hypothetical protein